MNHIKILSAILLVAMILGACAQPTQSLTQPQVTTVLTQPPAPEISEAPSASKVRIGVIEPLTGAQALTGSVMKAGYEYAVEKINSEGGIKSMGGARLELVFGDHQGKQEIAISETERLIQQEKVNVMAGAALSGIVVAATTVTERLQIPFVVDVPAAAAITERGFKWVFRTNINGRLYNSTLLDFTESLRNKGVELKKMAIFYPDTEAGKSFLGSAADNFTKAGYEIVFHQAYPPDMQDFTTMLTEVKVKEPDIIAINDFSVGQSVLIFQQMSNLKLSPKVIIAADGTVELADWADSVGGLKDGFFIMTQWNPDLPKMDELAVDFKTTTGKELTGFAVLAIQTVYAIAEAVEKAGTVEPLALQRAFQDLQITPGPRLVMPWSCVDYDETGQNTCAQNIVIQWQNDAKITVFPFDLAAEQIIAPVNYWQKK